MFNKVGFITIAFLLLLSGIGLMMKLSTPENSLAATIALQPLIVAQFIRIFLLIYNGTIINTSYFRIILAGVAVMIVGALFKIMHWYGGDALLLIGSVGVSITYFLRFLKKDKKELFDIAKLLWVIWASIGTVLIVFRWLPKWASYISDVFLWGMILYLAVQEFRKKPGKSS